VTEARAPQSNSSSPPVVAVSPIVGGRAIKGPTAKMMQELGLAVILVTHDLIGLFPWFTPKFVSPEARVADEIRKAVQIFIGRTRSRGS
jgi:predicted GTPase